jgi:hypothetical protein
MKPAKHNLYPGRLCLHSKVATIADLPTDSDYGDGCVCWVENPGDNYVYDNGGWHRFSQPVAEEKLEALQEEVKNLKAKLAKVEVDLVRAQTEGQCDACLGAGKSLSGGPCMCHGTGRIVEGVAHLRKALFDAEKKLAEDEAQAAVWSSVAQAYRDALSSVNAPEGEEWPAMEEAQDAYNHAVALDAGKALLAEVAALRACSTVLRQVRGHLCAAEARGAVAQIDEALTRLDAARKVKP